MMNASELSAMQSEAVSQWHHDPTALPDAPPALVRQSASSIDFETQLNQWVRWQHSMNHRLWHEEDAARDPHVDDHEIARVKRAIDSLNQRRNDAIESIDLILADRLESLGVSTPPDAKWNTETPGSAIDRLSIISQRIYHYQEQADQPGSDDALRHTISQRLERCQIQRADLTQSLQELIDDLFAGRKCHKIYRQMKMYNDARFNPRMKNA